MVDEAKTIVNARAFESKEINHNQKLPENNGKRGENSRRREVFYRTVLDTSDRIHRSRVTRRLVELSVPNYESSPILFCFPQNTSERSVSAEICITTEDASEKNSEKRQSRGKSGEKRWKRAIRGQKHTKTL